MTRSINFFHLGSLIGSTLNLLQRWEVVIVTEPFVIIIDAEAKLDHSMNSACELRRLIKIKARSQEGGVKKQPNEILDSLIGFVSCCFLLELTHDGMLWVDLHCFLGHHV